MTRPLASGYRAEVDSIDPRAWYEQVAAFSDANLYQLWHHGAGDAPLTRVSPFVLRKDGEVVAAAEVRLFRLPVVRRGIAYVLWGPVCRRHDLGPDVFRQAIRAMRNEYVGRRGMVLRISPRLLVEQHQHEVRAMADEEFSAVEHVRATTSLVVDLTPDLEELRRDLEKKWRNCLSKAERSGLTIESGTGLDLFDAFVGVYDRMLQRKQFAPSADIQKHRRIQQHLPEHLKMRVVVASHEGQPCAGAIYSALGDTAVYLFGATDDAGMRTSASYLVQWEVVTALKAHGSSYYDLNGINPASNPGTYHFKLGLAGKKANEVTFAGQFQASDASIANYPLLLADRVRHGMRTARARRAMTAAHAQ